MKRSFMGRPTDQEWNVIAFGPVGFEGMWIDQNPVPDAQTREIQSIHYVVVQKIMKSGTV